MLRNKAIALELLSILFEEPTGSGMNRAELRSEFGASELGAGLNTEDQWSLVDYHLHLLETAGFVKLTEDDESERGYDYFEMTWSGHDYLDENAPVFIPDEVLVG